jgi:pimeloyl-ACP methyl ester carboxylesterase
MEGSIFQINNQLSYFIKGKSNKLLFLIGGLGDLLFSVKYFEYLWNKLEEYKICIPIMRSSGNSFGNTTIWDDVEDIKEILKHIINNNEIKDIFLIGHSTGCQDILCLFKKEINKEFPIRKCILQGPVSDRDFVINDINLKNEIKRIENKSNILFKDWNNSELKNSIEVSQYLYDNKYPLLIRRFASLYSKLGDEDWFSFDIESNKLKELYSIINIPFLFVFSLNDQYVNYTNKEYKELIQRIEKANSHIKVSILKDDHFIENSKDEFFRIVSDFFS